MNLLCIECMLRTVLANFQPLAALSAHDYLQTAKEKALPALSWPQTAVFPGSTSSKRREKK